MAPDIARVLALQFNEAYERKKSQRRMSNAKPGHPPDFEDFAAKFDFEREQFALLGRKCIYGIELQVDNNAESRTNVLDFFAE